MGSSVDLGNRLRNYYSIRVLERQIIKNKSIIYRALIKQGYSNFSFEILEYCPAEKCIEREQYYLDLLRPEYNILKVAGSPLGFKHSEETIAKFKGRKHSDETKAKLRAKALTPERLAAFSTRLARLNSDPEFKAQRLEQIKGLNASPEQKER